MWARTLLGSYFGGRLLYPSLCWNDAETDDQRKEAMIDTKIIQMGN